METAALHLRITSDGMPEAKRGLDGLENAAGLVESAFKKLVAAAALFKAGSFIGEITQLTARYETLGVVMGVVGNNAGYTRNQMEQFAQGLQKAGISMLESRNTLAMMASAHIDLTNAQRLGRIAQDAAVIGNLNSSESFQRMIYGIQSGQTEILRTIGLNVNFEASYKKLAAQLGKSAQDLTEMEKVQARTNAVMEKGTDIAGTYEASMGTVGKAAKSLERIWENLQVLMGAVFQPAFVVVIDSLTAAMQSATEWAKKHGDEMARLGRAIGDTTRASVELARLFGDIAGGSQGAAEGVGFLTRIFQGIAVIIAGTTDVLRAFWGELSAFIGDMLVKLGRVLDFATKIGTLGYFKGEGSITGAGRGLQAYGAGIVAPLSQSTATVRVLDGMLNGMAVSHGTGAAEEAARIAEAARRKAEADRAATIAAAQAAQASGLWDAAGHWAVKGFGEEKFSPIHERTVPDIQIATLATKTYSVTMEEVNRLTRRLRQESRDSWDIISEVVTGSSRMASDELVIWMNNLDGVGRSWRTLGDTVGSVLREMVTQMQRAIIQQQLMDPLIKWGVGFMAGAFGGGGAPTTSPTTGGSAGGGLNWGEVFSAGPGTAPQASIVVNVTGKGADASVQQGGAGAVDLARMVEAACNEWAVKNSRANGMLARA